MKRLRLKAPRPRPNAPVWLFDLDDTLHNAALASMPQLAVAMGQYIETELGLSADQAHALRQHHWRRYGATLLGLMRHNGVDAADFLHRTHALPGLEERLRANAPDLHALARLPGCKLIFTNAPAHYAARVLNTLGLGSGLRTGLRTGLRPGFCGVLTIEDLTMFGHWRPKPDARMLRALAAKLRVHPSRCVLVEDSRANLKAARQVGMQTVWMRRWLRADGAKAPARPSQRPAYVDRRVDQLSGLLRWHRAASVFTC